MTEERNSFLLYRNFENQFRLLSMEDRGRLITAIFEYTRVGSVAEPLPPIVEMAFSIMRDAIDRDNDAYRERCRRNAENGRKGGRPRKDEAATQEAPALASPLPLSEKSEKTEGFSPDPEKADKDKDKDNDKDMDNDRGKDTDKDNGMDRNGGWESACEDAYASTYTEPPITAAPPPKSPLEEKEIVLLTKEGVPRDYIERRALRAAAVARSARRSAADVLREWWREDALAWEARGRSTGYPYAYAPHASEGKSYDLDEFAQAAIERSMRELAALSAETEEE